MYIYFSTKFMKGFNLLTMSDTISVILIIIVTFGIIFKFSRAPKAERIAYGKVRRKGLASAIALLLLIVLTPVVIPLLMLSLAYFRFCMIFNLNSPIKNPNIIKWVNLPGMLWNNVVEGSKTYK